MKIVVIGSGWLGTPLANQLQSDGHTVWTSNRSGVAPELVDASHHITWPTDNPAFRQILATAETVVFAFPPNRTSADAYAANCVEITSVLNADCKVLLISSTSVYPDQDGIALENSLLFNEQTTNAIAKAEFVLHRELGDRLSVLRLSGLIGPARYPATAMARSGKTYGGDEVVNVIHLDDAVGLAAFIIRSGIHGEVVNGTAAEHPSKGDYYTWMAQQLNIPAPLFSKNGSTGKIISSEKSRKLGYVYKRDNPYDFLN